MDQRKYTHSFDYLLCVSVGSREGALALKIEFFEKRVARQLETWMW